MWWLACSLAPSFTVPSSRTPLFLGCSFVRLHLALCVTSHPSRCFYPHPRLGLRVPLISPIVLITASSPHKQQAISGVRTSILTRLSYLPARLAHPLVTSFGRLRSKIPAARRGRQLSYIPSSHVARVRANIGEPLSQNNTSENGHEVLLEMRVLVVVCERLENPTQHQEDALRFKIVTVRASLGRWKRCQMSMWVSCSFPRTREKGKATLPSQEIVSYKLFDRILCWWRWICGDVEVASWN